MLAAYVTKLSRTNLSNALQKQVQLQVVPIFQTEKILLTELLHLLHLPYPYREIFAQFIFLF